jgi:protein involved in polysaccharide export with SLBB domain
MSLSICDVLQNILSALPSRGQVTKEALKASMPAQHRLFWPCSLLGLLFFAGASTYAAGQTIQIDQENVTRPNQPALWNHAEHDNRRTEQAAPVSDTADQPVTDQPDTETQHAGQQDENLPPLKLQGDAIKKHPVKAAHPTPSLPQDVKNPYPENPALTDLYRQYSGQASKTLERFGLNLFRNGTGNADKLPMDLPIGPDYVLGPGDGVIVNIAGGAPQRLQSRVDHEGRINLPEGGTELVAGATLAEAQRAIERTLSRKYKDPKVELSLSRLRSIRVYVVGDVERPGAYDISSLSTALNALCAAGGPTAVGSMRMVRHYHGQKLISTIDLYDLILLGIRTDVQRLQSGDSILVPPVGTQIAVDGAVRRPGKYELLHEDTLAQVLELAGDILPDGSLREIAIDRIEAHQGRVTRTLPIAADASMAEIRSALAGFRVSDGDSIYLAPISPFTSQSVYLEGHVFRAGKYAFHPGMSLKELIRAYSDLLPEPRSQAEIVRLSGPNLQPRTILFDLANVMNGQTPAPELNAFDVVRIFGRYDFDAPLVTIKGEVVKPGPYPLVAGMRVSDLLHSAGGFKQSAYRGDVLVASYEIRDGQSVQVEQKKVDLSRIDAGDLTEDLPLKAGDLVSIRQIPGWRDIGAYVTVSGEVLFPGSYGFTPGERLSSLVRRAGGFLPTAGPEVAVLQRQQVRELNAQVRQQLIKRIESAPSPVRHIAAKGEDDPVRDFDQQKKEIVARLRNEPDPGRLVIKISRNVAEWEGSSNDPQLCAGDTLFIPKEPGFVIVNGQVNNTNALTFIPGKAVGDYLKDAGGITRYGDEKGIFVIHADGTVVGPNGRRHFDSVTSMRASAGDIIVVPDKIAAESQGWKNLLNTAQIMSALAIAARVAISF